jgi:hypothetical protein
MTQKSGLRTATQIKADNEAFEKLSPAKKRVAIAHDVIAQLGRRLVVTQGTYLESDELRKARRRRGISNETEIRDLLNKVESCSVCAKGALFICNIDKINKLKIADLSSDSTRYGQVFGSDITTYLERLFDPRQLELIESAFEVTDMSEDSSKDDYVEDEIANDIQQAIEFGKLFQTDSDSYDEEVYTDANSLLRAIMENIIVNKGTFKPEIQPVRGWITAGFRY